MAQWAFRSLKARRRYGVYSVRRGVHRPGPAHLKLVPEFAVPYGFSSCRCQGTTFSRAGKPIKHGGFSPEVGAKNNRILGNAF